MVKKFFPGVMVALIALLSLFGTGQAYAAELVGGSSLSKYWFTERGELAHSGFLRDSTATLSEEKTWIAIDDFLDDRFSRTDSAYYHVFARTINYDSNGEKVSGYDEHYFIAFMLSTDPEAKPTRIDGELKFQNPNTKQIYQYNYLHETGRDSLAYEWRQTNGLSMQNSTGLQSTITIIERLTTSTIYNPNNPPAYAVPGMTDPMQSASGPVGGGGGGSGDPTDPGQPTRPQPPDDSWDLIGWFKYLIDWIIYVFDSFVWLMKELGESVAEVLIGADNLVAFVTGFFSFLPPEIMTLIAIGIILAIILRIFKR